MAVTTRLLFVYGSLRPCAAHPMYTNVLASTEFVGMAAVCGCLYDLGCFPALVPSIHRNDLVYGELFKLPGPSADSFLGTLDNYEGFNADNPAASLYVRQLLPLYPLWPPNAASHYNEAWVYIYNKPVRNALRIPGGDYCQHLLNKTGEPRSGSSGADGRCVRSAG